MSGQTNPSFMDKNGSPPANNVRTNQPQDDKETGSDRKMLDKLKNADDITKY